MSGAPRSFGRVEGVYSRLPAGVREMPRLRRVWCAVLALCRATVHHYTGRKWSVRRSLAFMLVSSALLWALIIWAVSALVRALA